MSKAAEGLRARIERREATIAILGLGYVGLPTAVAFAAQGFPVIGADLNKKRVALVNAGTAPADEIDLAPALKEQVEAGRLRATADPLEACREADCVLLIVPTPVDESHQPDLSYVKAAAESAARGLKRGQMIILESTTYPGTSEEILLATATRLRPELQAGEDYGIAYCPERYNPGDPEHTLATLTRVVGALSPPWADCAAALYGTLNGGKVHRVSDLKTAEATKVIENIQRDLNIALVNELALIFERLGIDTHEVLDAAATKWNFVRFTPGPGVGGHCLPVDPYYLTSIAERHGYHPRVILAGRATNDAMPHHVVELVEHGLNDAERPVKGSRVAILGLAYKPDTADARESPAHPIVTELKKRGADLRLVDPLVPDEQAQNLYGLGITPLPDALKGAHAVVLVTDHRPIRALTIADMKEHVAPGCLLVDTRNLWPPQAVREAGLRYRGIGRPVTA